MKLTIPEIARCLALPESTVNRWIRQGRMPVKRVDNTCYFSQAALERWARERNLPYCPPNTDQQTCGQPPQEDLERAMKRGGIHYHVQASDVESALRAAAELVPELSDEQRDELFQSLLARERLASTGIGRGVAIPHPRTPATAYAEPARITTCFLENPIDFNAVDDEPVFVLFVLLSPSVKQHLHLLSRLAFCVRDDTFVDFLKSAPGPADFFLKITEFEKRLISAGY